MVEAGGFEPPNPEGADLQSAAFSHFATSPYKMVPTIGIEPTTYWLQINCSANWAKSAFRKKWWRLTGSNRWPSACKADALPTELNLHSYLLLSYTNMPLSIRQHFFMVFLKNFRHEFQSKDSFVMIKNTLFQHHSFIFHLLFLVSKDVLLYICISYIWRYLCVSIT